MWFLLLVLCIPFVSSSTSSSTLPITKKVLLKNITPAPLDSKNIVRNVQPFLYNISHLCRYRSLQKKLVVFHKNIKGLNKVVVNYLQSAYLKTSDRLLLLEINNLLLKVFTKENKAIAYNIKNNVITNGLTPAERFLYHYRLSFNLESEGKVFFYHQWAKNIYQGLKCLKS